MNLNSVVSVVRDFILIEFKQCRERSQRLHLNSIEFKQCSKRRKRFHFNSIEVKQRSDCSQISF